MTCVTLDDYKWIIRLGVLVGVVLYVFIDLWIGRSDLKVNSVPQAIIYATVRLLKKLINKE